MPFYKFQCPKCDEKKEDFLSIAEMMEGVICSCGEKMEQDFNCPELFHQTDRERLSRALAVDISQLESGEAQRVHPGTEFRIVGDIACPVIRNRADKKRLMKERGWVEYE